MTNWCPVSVRSGRWRRCRSAVSLRAGAVGLAALPLAGCIPAGAPAIPMFGAYFPSWLLCAVIGVLGAVLVRLVFVRAGIDDALPVRLPVYVCVAAGIGFAVALLGFGR
ncbi:YtcA family lipoprotein [Ancylobacter rudongensis]|uniref:Uncharacterized protein YtcA n=1 Tax=Ancylobacter rudongensis TaxID=177413 RepID=A0A1G4Q430_9HYPH|nr:YtcA family lipoprotein [Ancylobacter rudongensis]SCW39394.1 Uncharacterised protein family protein [Ancylobacter rudongensis]